MPEPIAFTSTTPRFNLPVLFAAQAQKEFFVNQAHAIIDAISHPLIEGFASSPPASPAEGEAWIVLAPGEDAWSGQDDTIATFIGGQWLFISPVAGMQAFDQAASRRVVFLGNWAVATEPTAPSGGTTIDTEARTAIEQVIGALRQIGVFSPI